MSPLRRARAIALVVAAFAALAVPVAAGADQYRVQDGEVLSTIAVRNGTSAEALARLNQLRDANRIYPGQVLELGVSTSVRTHTVEPGETLSEVAAAHGLTSSMLATANGISDPDRIRPGLVLEVPAPSSSASTSGRPLYPAPLRSHPDRITLRPLFDQWATQYELPADLLMAVAWIESGWQSDVVSSAGAVGVGQLMPDTIDFVQDVLLPGVNLDPFDESDSIRMSARFLRYLTHRVDTIDDAVAAYYQGLRSVTENGRFGETDHYVFAVSTHRPYFVAD